VAELHLHTVDGGQGTERFGLLEDPLQMRLHRPQGNAQDGRNLFVRQPFTPERQNLKFPWAQMPIALIPVW
jgi:hypothetical protein